MGAHFFLLVLIHCSHTYAEEPHKPVLRLDEIYVEGNLRRPPVVDLQGAQLNRTIELQALQNLIRLEKRLLEPFQSLSRTSNKKFHK